MELNLIEIAESGETAADFPLTEIARSACAATSDLYQKVGFERPWIGYLAEHSGGVVGMCGFKSPPKDGRVEIAYGTLPGNEGRGIATQMARQLIQLAQEADHDIEIFAQTLPEHNASTAILRKLGFRRTATIHHAEDGKVWEWSLQTARAAVLRQSNEGRTIAVVGDVYRFLATGDDTDGKYAMWEAIVPPGGGPPPHVHSREEESFVILEGEVTFQIGDEVVVAKSGMFANMPVGCPHSFKNKSEKPARMIISVAPAGLEEMFFEFGVPLEEGSTDALPPTQAEIEKLLKIAPNYGIEIMVPDH